VGGDGKEHYFIELWALLQVWIAQNGDKSGVGLLLILRREWVVRPMFDYVGLGILALGIEQSGRLKDCPIRLGSQDFRRMGDQWICR